MTSFELTRLCLEPFLLPLQYQIRRRILALVQTLPSRPAILDVGGRKSPYTIGVAADVTLLDLPRESDQQHQLYLGLLPEHLERLRARRSNIQRILLEDMTHCTLPDASFDLVISVEVLEHVEQDQRFVQQVARVLRPGGWFLMTTPNGDYAKQANPGHYRHYTREQLQALLADVFSVVEIEYAVRDSRFHRYGLVSWTPRKPGQTILSMFGNLVSLVQSSSPAVKQQAWGTQHLVALAGKRV